MEEKTDVVKMESNTTIVVDAPESTSSSTEWTKVLPVEAMNHLVQGKRHLLVQDYTSAAASLQEACELYVKFYGHVADECGEVYFHYGKALLELARQETGVLGDALPGGSEDDESKESSENAASDEEGEEDEEEGQGDSENAIDENNEADNDEENEAANNEENEAANNEDTGAANNEDTGAANDEGDEAGDAQKLQEEMQPSSSADNEAGPSSSGDGAAEKEEDISTLQLSWEVLETAKLIFKRKSDDRETKLRLAEILLALGEISMESENYMAAIEDLQDCLKIHKQYLSPDDRLLAETYYQLGLAYVFNNQFAEGRDSHQSSVDTISLRISTLKTQPKPTDICDFAAKDPEKEIKELEALLPDLKAKVDDTLDLIERTKNDVAEAFKKSLLKSVDDDDDDDFKPSHTASNSSVSAKPINNISHLLKRKKPEDHDSTKQSEAKKLKLTLPVTNGSSDG